MRTSTFADRWVGTVLVATIWFVGSPIEAQTTPPDSQPAPLSLEQTLEVEIPTVVGASRFAQQVVDAPATVTIVTRDEIERFGYRTFGDVLRGVRGFYVDYDRNYSYVGARGFLRPGDYNSRILLLIDGHRLNDNIYDQAPIGTEFPIELDLIDRIEIVRGPSSSLYGTSAFFAVVNVVMRKGSSARSEAELTVGSQATREGRLSFARTFADGGDLQLSATRYGSDGERQVIVDGSGLSTFDMDQDRATRLFGAYSRSRWSAQGVYSSRNKGIPTGAYGVSLTDPSETRDVRGYFNLRYEGPVRGTSLVWNSGYDWYSYDGYYAAGAFPTLKDYGYGKWLGSELTASRRVQKHLFTGGTEVRANLQQDQGSYNFGADGSKDWVLDDRRSSSQWGLYAQDEFTVSRHLIVSAGLRYDLWPTFGGTTNPRVGVIFKPRPNSSLKILHGTAFRAPNLYELYYYSDVSRDLRPERIQTTEVAWEQHVAGPTRITVSSFRYRIHDLISQVPMEGTVDGIGFANFGVTHATGAEAEVERNWRGVQVLGSYTFTLTNNGEGTPLSNSPRHLAVARVTAPLHRLATVGTEWAYTSDRRTLTGDTASGFALGSLTVTSRELPGRLRVSVDLHNLLDARYSDPGGEEHLGPIRQDGRTARVRFTWRF